MGDIITYSEGLSTSYRNPLFKASYPFGHGLSYTTFDYGEFKVNPCGDDTCVKGVLTNTGSVAAKALPQLYLEFPIEAGFPAPILKGFQKNWSRLSRSKYQGHLPPHTSRHVIFRWSQE